MLKSEKSSESGSYTMEACVSLVAFLVAIMFVYSQIKVMICENIMQHAVDSMASEMATYVYVLNRAGFIIEHRDDELSGTNGVVGGISDVGGMVEDNIGQFASIYEALEGGDISGAVTQFGSFKGNASSMVDSIKNVVQLIKDVDWKKEAGDAGRNLGENAIKAIGNTVLSEFYNWKLEAYLPADRDKFCKKYLIDPDSISFGYSRILPGDSNNCIVVAVSYETLPAYRMFPIKRKIVKTAYTAAWVDSNTHKLRKSG